MINIKKLLYPVILVVIFLFLLISINAQAQSDTLWSSKKAVRWFNRNEWSNGLKLKPHKSVNKQEFAKQYHNNKERWDKAFAFLKETDLTSLKPGKIQIDGESVFATVTEGPTKDIDQTRWEAHKIYQDIHYVIKGKEKIGIAPVSLATVVSAYDPTKDIGFYTARGKYYKSKGNTFFIIFPPDAHRPGIKVDDYTLEKKIVIKVRAGD